MTTLTSEQITLYTTRLTEAESALHTLNIGQQARVFVDQNGERVEFTATNRAALRAYVMELKTLLGQPITVAGPMQSWML